MSLLVLQVLSNNNPRFGYNAAIGKYEDLMAAGIIDPTTQSPAVFDGLFLG